MIACAFADRDYELARSLKLKDRELDALTDDVNEKLLERATADSELLPTYVDLIFVARALERIGDGAVPRRAIGRVSVYEIKGD